MPIYLATERADLAAKSTKWWQNLPLYLAEKSVLVYGKEICRFGSKSCLFIWQQNRPIRQQRPPLYLATKLADLATKLADLAAIDAHIFGNRKGRFGSKINQMVAKSALVFGRKICPCIWKRNLQIWQQKTPIYLATKSADLAAKAVYIFGNGIGRFGS